ncbi:MAG: phenylalanine--tRNA ligase subunit beta [Fervidicoccaceae archaeon]
MPVVAFRISRLDELTGEAAKPRELTEILARLKCEVEEVDPRADRLVVEVTSDRPDLLAPEGLARALKGVAGAERGLPKLRVAGSGFSLRSEAPSSRPYIAVGILEGYELDEGKLVELIQFQEKLHATVGRGRRKVAIGLHALEKLPRGEVLYAEVDIREVEMTPLGSSERLKIEEVLRSTEQGAKYGTISLRSGRYHPAILVDGEVISLPPVINSELTRLEPGSKGLFVDVTGTSWRAVSKTLDLLLSVLSEERGTRIGLVEVKTGSPAPRLPELSRGTMKVESSYVSRKLGLRLEAPKIAELLEVMRWGAEARGDEVIAIYPEHRIDILHPVDLVEDVAIAYGYDELPAEPPRARAKPRRLKSLELSRRLSLLAVGLGFLELRTFVLVPSRLSKLSLSLIRGAANILELVNPVVEDMDSVRPSIIPSLLLSLRENQRNPLPLKLFEVGDVAYVAEDGAVEIDRSLGLAVMDHSVSFEDAQGPLFSILRGLGLEPSTKRRSGGGLLTEGRAADVFVRGELVGAVGEVDPGLLTELDIKYPAAIAEVRLGAIERLLGLK